MDSVLLLLGCSFRSAGIGFREGVAARAATVRRDDPDLAGTVDGFSLLETCNRIEFYLHCRDPDRAAALLLAKLGRERSAEGFYLKTGLDVVRHLFRVAAGLDSPVAGEEQILGQVREAGRAARRAGSAGSVLSFLFDVAYSSGKRTRKSYRVPAANRSLSAFALKHALKELGRRPRGVLLIGSGETSRLAARAVEGSPVYLLSARRELGPRFPGVSRISRSELGSTWDKCDLVVAATRHDGYALSPDDALKGKPSIVLDLAFPRNVDPRLKGSRATRLYDLDDVVAWTEPNHLRGLAAAERLVEEEVQRFGASLTATRLTPTLAKIYKWADSIREEETATALRKLPDLSPRQRAVVEVMAKRLTGKLMSPHASFVKGVGNGANQRERLLLLESIFGEDD